MTTATTITTVTEQLQQEETKLKEQLNQHQTQVNTLQADLQRLQTAIKALTSNHKGTTKKQKRPNTKPAATQAEVTQAITNALAEGRVLTAEQITERVQEATAKLGKSRVGLALRIKQCLKDDSIEQQKNGSYRIRLK